MAEDKTQIVERYELLRHYEVGDNYICPDCHVTEGKCCLIHENECSHKFVKADKDTNFFEFVRHCEHNLNEEPRLSKLGKIVCNWCYWGLRPKDDVETFKDSVNP